MMMDDDDFDQEEIKGHHSGHGLSKAEQRRSNKPIMEKKRRARINHCLNELKSLILDAMKKDPARHSKLEKADILEMTVKHLQTVQRQQLAVAVATDPAVLHKFKSGFNECAGEVSRYIGHLDGVELGVKQRLVSHLANCVTGLQQLSPFGFGGSGLFGNAQDSNNNTRVSGPQLVQSRIPGSDLGLHIPSTNQTQPNTNYYSSPTNLPSSTVTSATIGTHSSAFTAVHRSMDAAIKSPPLSPSSSIASSEDSDYLITTTRHYHTIAHPQKYGESFKMPLRSPSNFKAFAPVEHKSPPQHQVVSSTVISQDQSPPQTYAQVKLEFKSLPMSRTVPVQQPLSVVTSQVYNIPGISENRKNPLDFSLKSRQCVATQTLSVTPSVKRSFPVAFEQSNDLISSSIVSPDKVPRFEVNVVASPEGRAFYRDGSGERRRDERPSTSTSSQDDKDMWRPW